MIKSTRYISSRNRGSKISQKLWGKLRPYVIRVSNKYVRARERTSRSSPVMRTSWNANKTGNQNCSSCVCRVGCLMDELVPDDKGHSGVLSILGIADLRPSIACRDFFWNLAFFENSVRHTSKSANAPWDMTTPSRELNIWFTFSYDKLTTPSALC